MRSSVLYRFILSVFFIFLLNSDVSTERIEPVELCNPIYPLIASPSMIAERELCLHESDNAHAALSLLVAIFVAFLNFVILLETRRTARSAVESARAAIDAVRQAEEGNLIARQSTRLEQRPWIVFENEQFIEAHLIYNVYTGKVSFSAEFKFSIRNIGKNVANRIGFTFLMYANWSPDISKQENHDIETYLADERQYFTDGALEMSLMPGQQVTYTRRHWVEHDVSNLESPFAMPSIILISKYRSNFENRNLYTIQKYHIINSQGNQVMPLKQLFTQDMYSFEYVLGKTEVSEEVGFA